MRERKHNLEQYKFEHDFAGLPEDAKWERLIEVAARLKTGEKASLESSEAWQRIAEEALRLHKTEASNSTLTPEAQLLAEQFSRNECQTDREWFEAERQRREDELCDRLH